LALLKSHQAGKVVEILSSTKHMSLCDVNACGSDKVTPLMMASYLNHPKCVLALLKAGAEVNARDVNGRTALFWACLWATNPIIVKILLLHAADESIPDLLGVKPLDDMCLGLWTRLKVDERNKIRGLPKDIKRQRDSWSRRKNLLLFAIRASLTHDYNDRKAHESKRVATRFEQLLSIVLTSTHMKMRVFTYL